MSLLHRQQAERRALERKLTAAKRALRREVRLARQAKRSSIRQAGGPIFRPGAAHSFDALSASTSARIGLAVAPLGSGETQSFGSLQTGHAWSSIKVPILVTLMRDRHEELTASELRWAAAAIEVSDNDAAAGLFRRLEQIHGGLSGASIAVKRVMASAGNTAAVTTAPPPPGAVSTYGQTNWSASEASAFYRALANGCLLGPGGTKYVLDLMSHVLPEQQWGLGEAHFDPSWSVAIKGGWGPEAASGGYLVRQSGVVRNSVAGIAVTMIAEDSSGFEAAVGDLNRIASWLSHSVRNLGPAASGC